MEQDTCVHLLTLNQHGRLPWRPSARAPSLPLAVDSHNIREYGSVVFYFANPIAELGLPGNLLLQLSKCLPSPRIPTRFAIVLPGTL